MSPLSCLLHVAHCSEPFQQNGAAADTYPLPPTHSHRARAARRGCMHVHTHAHVHTWTHACCKAMGHCVLFRAHLPFSEDPGPLVREVPTLRAVQGRVSKHRLPVLALTAAASSLDDQGRGPGLGNKLPAMRQGPHSRGSWTQRICCSPQRAPRDPVLSLFLGAHPLLHLQLVQAHGFPHRWTGHHERRSVNTVCISTFRWTLLPGNDFYSFSISLLSKRKSALTALRPRQLREDGQGGC